MRNIAIIPARGGSKRIPRKNIKDFMGKPVIAYSIEAAIKSKLFDEIMVSTEDEEIAKMAKKFGASVPFLRSKKNADDFASTADVLLEVLGKIKENNSLYNNVCCIYPATPLISSGKIIEAYKLLIDSNLSSVITVAKFSYPIQRALQLNNERLEYMYPKHKLSRSQDLPTSYHDTGQFYWLNRNDFLSTKEIFTLNSGAIVLSENEYQDIDNEDDWRMAEIKYTILHNDNIL